MAGVDVLDVRQPERHELTDSDVERLAHGTCVVADQIAVFGDSMLYVNTDECTSCTACYQPDVCPVGAIYSEEHLPDGTPNGAKYNSSDPNKGHDHTFFVQHSRDVFAD